MTAATELIVAAITGVGLDAYDGHPTEAAAEDGLTPTPYAAVFDDSGLARRTHLSATSKWVWYTYPVIVAARSSDRLREAVETVRDALTDFKVLPNASPLAELAAGPVLSAGPEGDERLSKTLTYGHRIPRSTS